MISDDDRITERDRHMADSIVYCIDIGTNNRKLGTRERHAIRKLVNNLVCEAHIKLALMGFDSGVVTLDAHENSPRWGRAVMLPEGMEDG